MAREDAETRGVEMLASCSSWGAERRGLGQLTEGIDCWANGRWNDHWTAPGASPGPGPTFFPPEGGGIQKKGRKNFPTPFFPAIRSVGSQVAFRGGSQMACEKGMRDWHAEGE